MTERTKKILFAVFFVGFSIGMGYLLYIMFFSIRVSPSGPTTPEQPITGSLPQAGAGQPQATTTAVTSQLPLPEAGIVPGTTPTGLPQAASRVHLLSDSVTQAVTPSTDGKGARFYNPDDGRFYHVNADGSITVLADKQFFNVQDVSWANNSDQVILAFPDQSKVYYDFKQQRQVVLPKHWSDFTFSPDDSQVVSKSIGVDPENRFLISSKPDGTEARALEALGNNADLAHTNWSPAGQIVGYSFTGEPQGGDLQQQVLFIGQHHENFKSIVAPGADFLPSWSPSGKTLLFSVFGPASDGKPNLWVASGDTVTMGAGRRNLNLQTWSDKCAWADDTNLYCGIPVGLPSNAGLQRQDFATLPDDVYHIDLKNGTSVKISTPEQNHPLRNPVINTENSKLIFTDAEDGKLYSYDLQ